jgi:hypothetical protein
MFGSGIIGGGIAGPRSGGTKGVPSSFRSGIRGITGGIALVPLGFSRDSSAVKFNLNFMDDSISLRGTEKNSGLEIRPELIQILRETQYSCQV